MVIENADSYIIACSNKISIMMKSLVFLLITATLTISCENYNEDVFEVVGSYDTSIIGLPGSFDMIVASDSGDNILIEAPFDGSVIDVISADLDCVTCEFKEIDIERQELDGNIKIWGRGLYSYGTIQLDYEMDIDGVRSTFIMIGSRL